MEKNYFPVEGVKFWLPKRSVGDSYRILDPPKKCINQNPNSGNQYFTELASKLIKKRMLHLIKQN